MTAKKIFVLNGHPGGRSLSRLFSETYAEEAQAAGHTIRLQHLSDLDFDIDAEDGNYQDFKPLEPPVETFLQNLEWADHVVVAAPLWWGGLPAKLKGLFDRALIPGRAFDTRTLTKIGMPTPILTGKTGRFIMTSDTPSFFLRWVYKNAVIRQLTGQIFGFVGIKPLRFTHLSGASHPKPGRVDQWTSQVRRIGAKAA